jgi:uncharacterized protein
MSHETSGVQMIALRDIPAQSWKNGGGITRELLTWPSKENWVLRISVADIVQDGAFSRFEGVHRAFAVIAGAGVTIQFSDGERSLTCESEPLLFDGGDAPYCKLIDGATRDLNIMWRGDHKVVLTRAYAGESPRCHGYFSLHDQTLAWNSVQCIFPTSTGSDYPAHIGWWINFL